MPDLGGGAQDCKPSCSQASNVGWSKAYHTLCLAFELRLFCIVFKTKWEHFYWLCVDFLAFICPFKNTPLDAKLNALPLVLNAFLYWKHLLYLLSYMKLSKCILCVIQQSCRVWKWTVFFVSSVAHSNTLQCQAQILIVLTVLCTKTLYKMLCLNRELSQCQVI